MHFSDKITLISVNHSLDDIGNDLTTESSRTIYADVQSVSQSEALKGRQAGLSPEWKVLVHTGDYMGEPMAEVNGARLSVYRSYCAGDRVELYLERKTGTK